LYDAQVLLAEQVTDHLIALGLDVGVQQVILVYDILNLGSLIFL
jgi:hypothetical protein